MGVPSFSEPDVSNEKVSPSKSGKKIPNSKAKPKKKESSEEPSPSNSALEHSDDYSQRGLFQFTQKAKHRFIEHYNMLSSDYDVQSKPGTFLQKII